MRPRRRKTSMGASKSQLLSARHYFVERRRPAARSLGRLTSRQAFLHRRARELTQRVFADPARRRLLAVGEPLSALDTGAIQLRVPAADRAQRPAHGLFYEVAVV